MFETVAIQMTRESQLVPDEAALQKLTKADLMTAVSKAVDLLEGRPLRHGIRIAVMAGTLANALRLSHRQKTALLYASLLHDVGLVPIAATFSAQLTTHYPEKTVFSRHTLFNARIQPWSSSPSQLEPQHSKELPASSLSILQSHPQAAARFVEAVHLSSDIPPIIAASHELLDGSGYPMGLSGDAISIESKLLGISDTLVCLLEEVDDLHARKDMAEHFVMVSASGLFEPELVMIIHTILADDKNDHLLQTLFNPTVEITLHRLFNEPTPQPAIPMEQILAVCRHIGQLPDQLMPLHRVAHGWRVATLAMAMAKQIGISSDQTGQLVIAGLLQDLGMLNVPLQLLHQPDYLTLGQRLFIKEHPYLTETLLKPIPHFETISRWTGDHHERMNGSGYPYGKKGNDIPVAARILAVADVYTALTSSRPYRHEPYEPLDAIPILGQGRFKLYDSFLVNTLREVVMTNTYVVDNTLAVMP